MFKAAPTLILPFYCFLLESCRAAYPLVMKVRTATSSFSGKMQISDVQARAFFLAQGALSFQVGIAREMFSEEAASRDVFFPTTIRQTGGSSFPPEVDSSRI